MSIVILKVTEVWHPAVQLSDRRKCRVSFHAEAEATYLLLIRDRN